MTLNLASDESREKVVFGTWDSVSRTGHDGQPTAGGPREIGRKHADERHAGAVDPQHLLGLYLFAWDERDAIRIHDDAWWRAFSGLASVLAVDLHHCTCNFDASRVCLDRASSGQCRFRGYTNSSLALALARERGVAVQLHGALAIGSGGHIRGEFDFASAGGLD